MGVGEGEPPGLLLHKRMKRGLLPIPSRAYAMKPPIPSDACSRPRSLSRGAKPFGSSRPCSAMERLSDERPVEERVLSRLESGARHAFPRGIAGAGATRGGGAGGAQTRMAPNPQQSLGLPGRYRLRPGDLDRHRRSAGRGPTLSRPATCRNAVPHTRASFPCTSTLMSISHLRIGNGLPRTALKSQLPQGGSTAIPNGRRSCLRTRGSEQFPHLGDPAETGLKAAHFRNRFVVHAEDGPLDARGLAPGRGDGPLGGCTGRGAVSGLVQFPRIVRARSSGLRAHATPTASTDRPSSRSASQSLRCRSRHEWSAVEVS